ncbi:MAG: Dna2/Cas4 domain-containing protein [Methanobacteriales archaeon]|nr:Dna2/Cas4 domain-containing protein [Methanobacteriales archaeon]
MNMRVSLISEYLFCPFKLYIEEVDERSIQKIKLIRGAYNDFKDLIGDVLPLIHKGMGVNEIRDILKRGVERLAPPSEIEKILEMEAEVESIKIKRFMDVTGKDGYEIRRFIANPSLSNYRIYDDSLELYGNVHRIEIIKGKYHPIKIKIGLPPYKGVWDSDALEVAAYALLIEKEFKSEVLLGFVDYILVGERRPVTIDQALREDLLTIIGEIKGILMGEHAPSTNLNPRKCEKCNYNDICPEKTIRFL